jgi:hypothetical protein
VWRSLAGVRRVFGVAVLLVALLVPGAVAVAAAGTPVDGGTAMYPRAVPPGRRAVLLTVTQFPPGGPAGAIYEHAGGGFQRAGTIADPDAPRAPAPRARAQG